MAKKHDEGRDVVLLNRIPGVTVNQGQKQIVVKKNATVGIHAHGKIDFLTHYCGYVKRVEE